MLKDLGLPLEFWDRAIVADAYLRNRTATVPVADDKLTSPEEAWTGEVLSIDHVRVWGCKCYSYVDSKSLPAKSRHDKLMDRGRVAVLVGYDERTTSQYQVYTPDMHSVIKASVVKFDEDAKGGDLELKLPKITAVGKNALKIVRPNWNGESNTVPDRKPRGRPPKATPSQGEPITAAQKAPEAPVIQQEDPPPIVPEQPSEPPDTSIASDPERKDVQDLVATKLFSHVKIPKRRRNDEDNNDAADCLAKRVRALLAFSAYKDENSLNGSGVDELDYIAKHICGLIAIAAREDEFDRDAEMIDVPLLYQIPMPTTYEEVISDPIYGKFWLAAANLEVEALTANRTWDFVKAPRGVNLVTNKWVFSVKYTTQGAIERYKARLVARGFSQVHGVDYSETFAPTSSLYGYCGYNGPRMRASGCKQRFYRSGAQRRNLYDATKRCCSASWNGPASAQESLWAETSRTRLEHEDYQGAG